MILVHVLAMQDPSSDLGIELWALSSKGSKSLTTELQGIPVKHAFLKPQVPFGNSDMSLKGSHPLSYPLH